MFFIFIPEKGWLYIFKHKSGSMPFSLCIPFIAKGGVDWARSQLLPTSCLVTMAVYYFIDQLEAPKVAELP